MGETPASKSLEFYKIASSQVHPRPTGWGGDLELGTQSINIQLRIVIKFENHWHLGSVMYFNTSGIIGIGKNISNWFIQKLISFKILNFHG